MVEHLDVTIEIDLSTPVRKQSVLGSIESASIQTDFASVLAEGDRRWPWTKGVLHVYVVQREIVFVDTKRATGFVRPCGL